MPSNEDLYRDLREREEEEDAAFRQNRAPDALRSFTPKPIDHDAAIKRFNEDFAPVFRRREKAMTSLAYRLFLKATGQWKGMEVGDVEVVNPSAGLTLIGPTVEDVQREIAANPTAFKHLAKNAPAISHVPAERRNLEAKLSKEPRDNA
jgi:hypothetical protein